MFWVIKDLDYISPSSATGAVVPKKRGQTRPQTRSNGL